MPLEQTEIDALKGSLDDGKFAEHPEIKKLSDLGFKIHTENTLKSEIDSRTEEAIKPQVREIYTRLEGDIKTITGIEKQPNEKAYDYLKRAVPEFATKKQGDEMKKLQEQIEEYKAKIEKGTDPEGHWQEKLTQAENKYKTELEKIQNELKTERQNVSAATKRRILSEIHSPIKTNYRSDLPSYFFTTEKQILKEALENSVVVQDEKGNEILVEADENGEPKKDASFQYVPVSKRLEEAFKDAVKKDPKKGGAGSNPSGDDPIDPSKITVDNFEMPEGVKTKGQLTTHLMELGLKQGSDIFDKIYDKHSANLKFR